MNPLKLRLPSHPSSISEVEPFVKKIANRYSIGQDKYPNILISLTEAVNNAINHGNKNDQNKFVIIGLTKVSSKLCIKVEDEGCGFDPNDVPDPTAPENIGCCGGRGVFLIRELSDDVRYVQNGCVVEMFFKL